MNNKTFLITGGTGYLGSHLVRRLIIEGSKVIVLKRSFSNTSRLNDLGKDIHYVDIDTSQLEDLFKNTSIDVIFHCATNYGKSNTKPTQLIEANLLLPLNLLQLAAQYHVKKFINTDTILDTRVNFYALSKGHFSEWLKTFSSQLICCNIALEHFYGPQDDITKFVSFIVREFISNAESINLTPGEQKRDFIHIADVVEAIVSITNATDKYNNGFYRFEVGTGVNVSIREIVELIQNICQNHNTKVNYGAMPYRNNETMESKVNLAPLLATGWSPSIDIKSGLINTVAVDRHAYLNQKILK